MSVKSFIPSVWAGNLLQPLKKSLVYGQPGVINRDYEGEIAEMGDRVKINTLSKVTIRSYARQTSLNAPEFLDTTDQELIIDQGDYFVFGVDDVDARQARASWMNQAMEDAAYELADDVDEFLAALMAAAVPTASTVGSTSSPKTDLGTSGYAYNYLVELGKKLDEKNNARAIPRWAIIPPWFHALMTKTGENFVHATDAGDGVLRNGMVGMAAGFMLFMSNNVPNTSSAKYKIIAGTAQATTYADQIVKMEAYRSQSYFADVVRGLHVYGAKVVRPNALAMLIANDPG